MSSPITIEDIYKLFQNSQEQADRRTAELERLMAESKAESDRRVAEAELLAAVAKAERERSMANLEKTVERTSKAVDALTTRWGRFVERLVEPAVVDLFQQRGIDVTEVYPRARTKR